MNHLLRFNKYPKLEKVLRKIAKHKNISFNNFLNDSLLEWITLKWNIMSENIEYFRKLSQRNTRIYSLISGLSGVLIFISYIASFLFVLALALVFPDLTMILAILTISGWLTFMGYIAIQQNRTEFKSLSKKLYRFGLKLTPIKLPDDAEYIMYHTKNGAYYLLLDPSEIKETEIRIPNNAEKIIIPFSQTSEILLAIQK